LNTPNSAPNSAPDVSAANPEHDWFGQPRQLARLFTTEMGERFGFYGMRALLTLYLTKHFLFSDHTTNGIYGGFTAMVYLTPLAGGLIADRYLGSKRSVKIGALVMALGYFLLCFGGDAATPWATINGVRHDVVQENVADRPTSTEHEKRYVLIDRQKLAIHGEADGTISLLAADGHVAQHIAADQFQSGGDRSPLVTMLVLLAISLIAVGNGFFKPNISTMVGALYKPGDTRKDAGFTIFYMGINLGAWFSQMLCPILADAVGWWAGFLLAAIGMVVSWALIQFDGGRLTHFGNPPAGQTADRVVPIVVGAMVAVPLVMLLFQNLMSAPAAAPGAGVIGYVLALPLMGKLLFGTFLVAVPGILVYAGLTGNRAELQMMIAAMVLITFNVVFWTLFEQAGSSLTLFADRNTDLHLIGNFSISAAQTQVFNSLFIIMLAPFMSMLWIALGRRGLEPSTPVKFGLALAGVGGGFLFLVWGSGFADGAFKVSVWWLAGLYLIHTIAELCISPVGLSMITKLSLARIVGLMMGVWFLSIAVAQYVAGAIAQIASVDTVGGEVTNPKLSLDTYVHVFTTIGWVAVAIGALLLALSWPIKRLMHGVN
jgi:POT family proton-dependent oligopeptide transporter